jgi:hypothetical protein
MAPAPSPFRSTPPGGGTPGQARFHRGDFPIPWRRSLSSDRLQRVQGLDGALVGVQGLHEPVGQVGHGVSQLTLSCGFPMALGEIEDSKGSAQLMTDGLRCLRMSTVSAGRLPVAIFTGPLRGP